MVVSGYVFAAPEWTSPVVPALTLAGACVGLALGVVVGHLRVHRWWGIALVWVGFVVGMVPPLSEDDALWIIAAPVLGLAAAVYLAVVNLLLVQASSRRSRRRS